MIRFEMMNMVRHESLFHSQQKKCFFSPCIWAYYRIREKNNVIFVPQYKPEIFLSAPINAKKEKYDKIKDYK